MTQSLKNFNIKYSCHCLKLWNKFFVHNTPNIGETDQHDFDLASRHPSFCWKLSPLFNPLFALPTSLVVIIDHTLQFTNNFSRFFTRFHQKLDDDSLLVFHVTHFCTSRHYTTNFKKSESTKYNTDHYQTWQICILLSEI